MTALSHYEVLVGMETDATVYHGEDPHYPCLLDKADAEQLAAHLGADLAALIPQISKCTVTVAASLYDQTQVLRPGFPIFEVLKTYAGNQGGPRLLSVGAADGKMPDPRLQPDSDIPPSVLQLAPILISGEKEIIDELSALMEHLFIERGQLSANTAMWLQQAFDIKLIHGRFMTLLDLTAMLHLQLDSFHFSPMWELLECALFRADQSLAVETPEGNHFHYSNGAVYSPFYSFDEWAAVGAGSTVDSGKHLLGQGYADWTRVQRQYLLTLRSHDLDVKQHLPGQEDQPIAERFMVEVKPGPGPGDISITEHMAGELGTVAITTVRDGKQFNYYPLTPAGLNDIHALLRDTLGSSAALSFPGYICYDEETRSLSHDPDAGGPRA